MIKLNTKIAVLLIAPTLSACQWHNISALQKQPIVMANGKQTQPPPILTQYLPEGPVTLSETIARGLTFNADYRAKALQHQMDAQRFGRGPFDLFPKIHAHGDFTYRSNKDASVSARVTPTERPRSTEHYTAVDQPRGIAAIEATWSLLDLGLAAFNRKIATNEQEAKHLLWQHDAKRLSTDIVRAFWRLNAYHNHHKTSKSLAKQVEHTLAQARQEARKPEKKAENLFFMRELTDIYRYLLSLERAITDAPAVMNNLLELPQSTKLSLIAQPMDLPLNGQTSEQWIEKALIYSPDLNTARSNMSLHGLQTKRDIVALLPSITAFLGLKLDTNSFLLNGDWLNMGLRGSWNLMRLLELPKMKRTAKAKAHYQRQLIVKAASLVARQSVIAHAQFRDANVEMRYAQRALKIQRAIVAHIAKQVKKNSQPQRILVKERVLLALASIRHDLARAELETAKARMAEIHGLGPNLYADLGPKPTQHNFNALLTKAKVFYEAPRHD